MFSFCTTLLLFLTKSHNETELYTGIYKHPKVTINWDVGEGQQGGKSLNIFYLPPFSSQWEPYLN